MDFPPEAEEYAVEGKSDVYSSAPLMALLHAVVDAKAGSLLMVCDLPQWRGIVSLDCGYQ